MKGIRTLTQEAVPGGNLGEVFTGNLTTREVIPQAGEAWFDSLMLSLKGDGAVAVVNLEDFLDLVQPFTFSENDTRINLRGRDLFALCMAFYGHTPQFREGAIGEDDKVHGIRIPLQIKVKPAEKYSFAVTRIAVTNLSGEVLQLSLLTKEAVENKGRIDAKEIPFTTAAAVGIQQVTPKLPKLGKILGILVFITTVPTATADVATVQRLYLANAKRRLIDAHISTLLGAVMRRPGSEGSELEDIMINYGWLDLRDDPIDAIAEDISLTIDSQVVSEAVRFIPVYEVPQ